jgi:PAS domain S-box-containing protein
MMMRHQAASGAGARSCPVAPPNGDTLDAPHDHPLSADAVWAIVEGAPDGIVMVDGEGCLVFANRRVEQLFGYPPGELVGQPVEVLVPEDLRDAHRGHRARYRRAPRVREMGSGIELVGRRRDGTTFPVEVSLSPVATAAGRHSLAIIRDVTQRAEDEAAVRRLQHLLDTSGEAVLLAHSETLELVYANGGARALTGYDRRQLLTMTGFALVPDLDAEHVRDVVEEVLGGTGPAVYRVAIRRRDGDDVVCDVLLQRFEWGGRLWLAAFARDMTDRVRAEEEHRRAEQALALVDQQERIARDLHDTVIQSLFGVGMSLEAASAVAGDPNVSARLDRAVQDIDRAIRGLRTTVFSLREPSPVNGGLRAQVAATVDEITRSLGFTPSVRFRGPVDFAVADEVGEQLLPALREALSNVARHAEAASVHVELSVGSDVAFRVTDDGIGLPRPLRRGRGLDNLERRAAALGGHCTIGPGEPRGTVVEWAVPLA